MSATLMIAWLVLVTIVSINAIAAGAVAFIHGRWKSLRRGMRALLASAFAAFLPTSTLVAYGIVFPGEGGTPPPLVLAIIFSVCFAVALVVALPGALLAARRLEGPGDVFGTFE